MHCRTPLYDSHNSLHHPFATLSSLFHAHPHAGRASYIYRTVGFQEKQAIVVVCMEMERSMKNPPDEKPIAFPFDGVDGWTDGRTDLKILLMHTSAPLTRTHPSPLLSSVKLSRIHNFHFTPYGPFTTHLFPPLITTPVQVIASPSRHGLIYAHPPLASFGTKTVYK